MSPSYWRATNSSRRPVSNEPAPAEVRTLNEEFRPLFIEETTEQLAEFEAGVLRLEEMPGDTEAVDVVFRFAHSLKGSSSMMGFTDIARCAHVLECLLQQIRAGTRSVTRDVIGALLASGDVLRELVGRIEAGPDSTSAASEGVERVEVTINALLDQPDPSGTPSAEPAGGPILPLEPPAFDLVTVGPAEPPRRRATDRDEATAIRVSVDKVDRLVNLAGELVTTQSMLAQMVADLTPTGIAKVQESVGRMDRHVRELHHSVLAVRMVSVRTLFARFPRFVRDLAESVGKHAVVELAGEETELDKSVIEKIADPLLHLVRNAIDHGLENPEGRRAAGKPAIGSVRLDASQRGGSIYIEVSDDGRGLDRDRILSRGRAQGLVAPGENPSDEDVFALIFRPGFSTAETVSELSGRGVGMDVVKRNVEALGGIIAIRSEAGRGTRFRIKLPLTLALLDGQVLRVGDQVYVLPLVAIIESVRAIRGSVHAIGGSREVIVVRGETLPLLRLGRLFGVRASTEDPTEGLVVIVENEERRTALLVDGLLGQQQVVIKSLDTHFRKVDGVAGATILGDGHVSLVLDVAGLIGLGRARGKE
jgi:two-component system chemotaxis sensor kinase CheA